MIKAKKSFTHCKNVIKEVILEAIFLPRYMPLWENFFFYLLFS